MIYNLLDNALKYAPESEEVRIVLREQDKTVHLEVYDQGPGIAEGHQKKVFDKFYRMPSGDVHNVKGYGLGLSYVQGVIQSHGWKVRVQNRENGGLLVSVMLPAYSIVCGRRALSGTDKPVQRKDILLKIWGDDSFYNSCNLDVYITKLRECFKETRP